MTRSSQPSSPSRPLLARPAVWAPIVLLVLAGVGFGVKLGFDAAAVAAKRDQLLVDIDSALRAGDSAALSHLTSLLQKLPDHDTAPELLAAQARIELARGRVEKAAELFLAQATAPGATPADQAIGLAILVRQHEAGTATDAAAARGHLEQAATLGDAAASELRSPEVLLMAWQVATRLRRADRSKAIAQELQAGFTESPAAKFVALAIAFTPKDGVGAVDAAVGGLVPEPIEADVMRITAVLDAGDLAGALTITERVLARAPGVTVARTVAATVFHACLLKSAAGSADRDAYAGRRDAQIDWLLRNGDVDEAGRGALMAMREQR